MIELSPDDKRAIADALEGTSGMYDHAVCAQHDLEMHELEEIATDMGLTRCEVCGWWVSLDETEEVESGFACTDCVE